MDWKITEAGFDPEQYAAQGNRFLVGNGYMGVRGTPDEYTKEQMPCVNLAGVYDQVGDGWREPVNAPNPFLLRVRAGEKLCVLPQERPDAHRMELDMQRAVLTRQTDWKGLSLTTVRFASLAEEHLLGSRTQITAGEDTALEITLGIDTDIWDLNGPHFDVQQVTADTQEEGMPDALPLLICSEGVTHEKGIRVSTALRVETDLPCHVYPFAQTDRLCRTAQEAGRGAAPAEQCGLVTLSCGLKAGQTLTLTRLASVYTSLDTPEPSEAAGALVRGQAYEAAFEAHCLAWAAKWRDAAVYIEGDDEGMRKINYSIYHLISIAPKPGSGRSIPARGLSGQTYKGAVFWDTEMFMLDFFLFTDPEVARSLMEYRVQTLDGARQKARQYGYEGAFYAWESQEGGYDGCTDYNVTDVFSGRPMRTFFREKQYHISGAVAYGILRYTEVTGDARLLLEGGAETVLECARFFCSLLVRPLLGQTCEIRDAIGPDEYHERINNNAYTNRIARFTLDSAAGLLERMPEEALGVYAAQRTHWRNIFSDAAAHLQRPKRNAAGVIEQFDGYFGLEDVPVDTVRSRLLKDREYWGGAYGVAAQTQVIKQADVVTMLTLFPDGADREELEKNWMYYEPRTEHGSSLSACMYALLACRCGMPDRAWPFFLKSAEADLKGGGKEWAGLIYIGGTHPAAAGGTWMTAVEGFGGVQPKGETFEVHPSLPALWQTLRFRIRYRGKRYCIEAKQDGSCKVKEEI